MPRGTPLYGQPSWWGDGEVDEKRAFKSNGKPEEKNHETGTSGKKISDYEISGYLGYYYRVTNLSTLKRGIYYSLIRFKKR